VPPMMRTCTIFAYLEIIHHRVTEITEK
jgi:hypothetical protein